MKFDYLEAQAKSGLKVGDTVKVLFKVPSNHRGWGNIWTHRMDVFVGGIYEIEALCGEGGITLSAGGYNFPFYCLEPVTSRKYFKKGTTRRGYGLEGIILENIFSLVKHDGDIVITEECDGHFSKALKPEETVKLFKEAIKWVLK